MIKLIGLDLDDTLLMPDCTIPQEVVQTLQEATQRGIYVVIATGRIFPTAKRYAKQLGSDCPIVCYNGSVIKTVSGKWIFSAELDASLVRRMGLYCSARDLYLQMYHDDKIVIAKDCPEFRKDPDSKETEYVEIGNLAQAHYQSSPKMMILNTPQKLALLYPEIEKQFGEDLHFATSKDYLLEMMPKNVSKKNALQILAEKFGVARDEVMVCGDNTNDMEMVSWAGLGVAVANAVPSLKAAAKYVTQSERSYGVMEAVKKFVL